MTTRLLQALLVSSLLAACAEEGGGGGVDAAPRTNPPGLHVELLEVGAALRRTLVYVPELARAGAAPVVFMLHGTSGDGQRFYEASGWKEKADAEGMLVVFPDALVHCFHEDDNHDGDYTDPQERKVTTKWSAGKLGEADGQPPCTADEIAALPPAQQTLVDHPVADDVAFFDAMLAMLDAQYVVDAAAVYVTGFSNGAQMTARLAVERADRIAAAHAAAGTLTVDGTSARPISMIFSVGTLDDRFTVPMGVAELPVTEAGLAALPLFQGIVAKYLGALQLAPSYTYELVPAGATQVARLRFATSSVGAANTLEVAVIEDLAHQYPNGTNHAVSAPDVLWTFFEAQRLP